MTLADLVADSGVTAIVGLSKNAGKTTVVNHLLAHVAQPLAIASLGLDGEARDALTGLAKPSVRPPAGTLVLTASALADGAQGTFPVVAELPYETATGRVVVCRAAGGGAIQVSGPTSLEELDGALAWLRRAGAERVLLEGALSRLGPAAPERCDAVVLACGAAAAAPGTLEATVRSALARLRLEPADAGERALLARALEEGRPVLGREGAATPCEVPFATGYERELADAAAAYGADALALPGALSEPLAAQLAEGPRRRLALVVRDATHVVAEPATAARLRRRLRLCAARALALVALTSSPFRPAAADETPAEALAAVAAAAPDLPVYDVVAGLAAEPRSAGAAA